MVKFQVNPSGSKYKGHMVDGIRTGYGVYTYADGVNHYEGQWQNNKAHGLGRFKEEESEYMGQWQDGEKHGEFFLYKRALLGMSRILLLN